MEFKSMEKWRVLRNFNLNDKQFKRIEKKMIKRHPLEFWIDERIAQNGSKVVYIKLEFVEWLEEVHFNKDKYYLDAEIKFFEKQVFRLENELNIEHYEFKYDDMSLVDLRTFFNRSKNAIGVAVNRMEKRTNKSYKYTANGTVMISKEGVKWLSEKYFRKQYLKDLEIYKLLLQNVKRKQNGFDELLIV